jgi:nucleoside-diphosphate-sugar epimerase
MQRTVVTGGAGFIGSHLCDALIARGSHVTCVDNLVGTAAPRSTSTTFATDWRATVRDVIAAHAARPAA